MDRLYRIRRDYLDEEAALSAAEKQAVEDALKVLESDPRPESYGYEVIPGGASKIRVSVEGEEISIIYEIRSTSPLIDLIRIKRTSGFKKALDWLGGLLEFAPKESK